MASQNNPNDPYEREHLKDPTRTYIDDRRSPADIDNELQVDPEMAEGPTSNTRIALFAVGIAIVLGVVFYGLNNSSITHQQQASTAPTQINGQKNTASTSPPAAPAGMRDVTPHANTRAGTTTGAAPANPKAPSPASTSSGNTNK